MGWGQNNVNLAIESEEGVVDNSVIGNGDAPKKAAKKWGFGKQKTVENTTEKKEGEEKEKNGEEGEEEKEESAGTKLDAPPVGLFETVRGERIAL